MDEVTRRGFHRSILAGTAMAGLGIAPALAVDETPALLGGKPTRSAAFPSWPEVAANDKQSWAEVLGEGKWCRLDGDHTTQFERTWAQTVGTAHCLATSCGTTALSTTLNALDIGPATR